MRLPVPPRARLSPGLLLLTLLLVAVCGLPVQEFQGARNQSELAEWKVQARDEQLQEITDSAPVTSSFSACLVTSDPGEVVYIPMPPFTVEPIAAEFMDDGNETGTRLPEHGGSDSVSTEDMTSGADDEDPEDSEDSGDQTKDSDLPTPPSVLDTSPADADACDNWVSCKRDYYMKYVNQVLADLPNCPCMYPREAQYGQTRLMDERLGHMITWRDASSKREYIHVYHPSAFRCLRSLPWEESRTTGAQLCCYDRRFRLLTRGKGAGSAELMSPYISRSQHFMVDILPWITCKGDWSRYHKVLPPNNGLSCPERPSREKYLAQLREAKEY